MVPAVTGDEIARLDEEATGLGLPLLSTRENAGRHLADVGIPRAA